MNDCERSKSEAREKLERLQYLEGMRHLQTLEAAEMAFLLPAFALVIGALINAPVSFAKDPLVFRAVFGLSALVAGLLIWHFWARRETYYWLRKHHQDILVELCWRREAKPGKKLFGIAMRAGLVLVLTSAVVLSAAWLAEAEAKDIFSELAVFLCFLLLGAFAGLGIGKGLALRRRVHAGLSEKDPALRYAAPAKRRPCLLQTLLLVILGALASSLLGFHLLSWGGDETWLNVFVLVGSLSLGLLVGGDVGERIIVSQADSKARKG